jgi:hypothetical protein
MALAELLPAIRALPQPERIQLLHLLIDEVTGTHPTPARTPADDIPEELRKLLPPPGSVVEVWFPEANPEAVASALEVLNESRPGQ